MSNDGAAPQFPAQADTYVQGMHRLVQAVQELSLARDLESVQRIVRSTARELTGCDGSTFVLRDDGKCLYADEDAIGPLWKGKRFPMETCISGWAMLHRKPAAIFDIYQDERIPHDAYRPTFVKSLVMVPIRALDPVGAIGNYWATQHRATDTEVRLLQALADSTSVAMENVALYNELEQRVRDRTAELQEAHDAILKLSITDELTGLCNRRGFHVLAEQALRHAARRMQAAVLVFIDVDGLKQVNDAHGHDVGDAMLIDAGKALVATLRHSDVVARMGGDEFCALALDTEDGEAVRRRLNDQLDLFNATSHRPYLLEASVGIVEVPPDPHHKLDALLIRADQAMYADKRVRGKARSSGPPDDPARVRFAEPVIRPESPAIAPET
jgi:diguanylate cyclase (GGDEF)-like protein